jgi:hypothetical protein
MESSASLLMITKIIDNWEKFFMPSETSTMTSKDRR